MSNRDQANRMFPRGCYCSDDSGTCNWCQVYYAPRSKYSIDEEMGIDYRDAGPWRSYHLTAFGNSEAELLHEASIAEVDQDGGDLACYSIEDAPTNEIQERAIEMIQALLRGKAA